MSRSKGKGGASGGGGDLFALIRAKQADREGGFNAMMESLEAKYGGSKPKGKGKKAGEKK